MTKEQVHQLAEKIYDAMIDKVKDLDMWQELHNSFALPVGGEAKKQMISCIIEAMSENKELPNNKVFIDALKAIKDLGVPFGDIQRSAFIGEVNEIVNTALASYAEQAPPDTGDRNPYNLDWPKQYPIMSNVQDRTGIGIEWQIVWSEVEGWYGDPKKKETGEQFLKRLQSQFMLIKKGGQVTGKSAADDKHLQKLSSLVLEMWQLCLSMQKDSEGKLSDKSAGIWLDADSFVKKYRKTCEHMNVFARKPSSEGMRKHQGILYFSSDGNVQFVTSERYAYEIEKYEFLDESGEAGKLPTQAEAEREVIIQAFDQVRQMFEGRSWIMEGRGSYPYNDDRYREEVRYLYTEFDTLQKDVWANIKSKSSEYREKIIAEYLKDQAGNK